MIIFCSCAFHQEEKLENAMLQLMLGLVGTYATYLTDDELDMFDQKGFVENHPVRTGCLSFDDCIFIARCVHSSTRTSSCNVQDAESFGSSSRGFGGGMSALGGYLSGRTVEDVMPFLEAMTSTQMFQTFLDERFDARR